jgi:hypothetical protein
METNEELALRVVKDMYWRWLPGMLDEDGNRWLQRPTYGWKGLVCTADGRVETRVLDEADPLLPDLSDPATIGCLRSLVDQAWGDTVNVYREAGGHWRAAMADCRGVADGALSFYAYTEAEALVLALEAAP